MDKTEIIRIWRDLILKAWLLKKATPIQKEKFLKLLASYEKKLTKDTHKYSQIVLWFIYDIRDDLESNREINIDSISDDEYIENYFVTKHELDNFNQLIDQESFKIIFSELQKKEINKKKIDTAIKSIQSCFNSHFKKIHQKNLAKNLLIFTTFERTLPLPALERLIAFMIQHESLNQDVLILKRIVRSYKEFLRNFYKICLSCYQTKKIHCKYIAYTKDADGKLTLDLKAHDASKYGLRSWSPTYEYKELLLKMT